jgi:predicted small lipoprotein YifL
MITSTPGNTRKERIMAHAIRWAWALAAFSVMLAGCGEKPTNPPPEDKPTPKKAAAKEDDPLASLTPEARQRVEAQKKCPVSDEPLGSMGTPVEIMIEDQPVYVCCEHCRKKAMKDKSKTLAKVKELKAQKD